MQFMTLDQLKQLETKSNVDEGAVSLVKRLFGLDQSYVAEGVPFKAVEKEWKRCYEETQEEDLAYFMLRDGILKRLCPPIKLIGEGSSRAAYACEGGRCLKVAFSKAGLEQNKHEWENTKPREESKGWPCFAQGYCVSKDYSLMVVECCAPVSTAEKLVTAFGFSSPVSFDCFIDAVSVAGKRRDSTLDMNDVISAFSTISRGVLDKEWCEECNKAKSLVESLISSQGKKSPAQGVLWSLLQFWKQNGTSAAVPDDLYGTMNWGFAIREGAVVPVVVDAGMTRDVLKKYYI